MKENINHSTNLYTDVLWRTIMCTLENTTFAHNTERCCYTRLNYLPYQSLLLSLQNWTITFNLVDVHKVALPEILQFGKPATDTHTVTHLSLSLSHTQSNTCLSLSHTSVSPWAVILTLCRCLRCPGTWRRTRYSSAERLSAPCLTPDDFTFLFLLSFILSASVSTSCRRLLNSGASCLQTWDQHSAGPASCSMYN